MTVKQIEKCFQKLTEQHQANVEYWSEVDKDVVKTVDSIVNHQEQMAMFSKLDVSRMKITKEFPDIKERLLHRLSNLTLAHQTKLEEHLDTFSGQSRVISELCSKCLESSLSVSASVVSEDRPGDCSLAAKVEQCYKLSRLYNQIEMNLETWLENRHSDKGVWGIKDALSLLSQP